MIIDVIIILVIIGSIITGIIRGFVKELSALAGLILGIYIAAQRYPLLEKHLIKVINSSSASKIISFLIIFLVVFFLIILLGLILQKVIQLVMLGWLDKLLGGVFGIVKGLIIVWLILMLVITVFPNTLQPITKSKLASRIMELGEKITKLQIKTIRSKKLLTQSRNSFIFITSQQHIIDVSCD
jgi:membrane protein required for colicin V production